MIRNKVILYMCSVFIGIEVILLVEQQLIMIQRDAVQGSIVKQQTTPVVGTNGNLSMLRKTTLTIPKYFVPETLVAKSIQQLKRENITMLSRPTMKYPWASERLTDFGKKITERQKKGIDTENLHTMHLKRPHFSKSARAKRRLDRIQHYCEVNNVEGKVERVIVNPQKTVSYCISHKVASTHWLRVFRYLWNDTSTGSVSSPSKISKIEAHFSRTSKIKEFSFIEPKAKDFILNTSRFMFVREPYIRLWSVFIDKFVLADNYFWSYHGPQIAKVNDLKVLPARRPCYHFSFNHFINYVISSSKSYNTMDDHMKPISRLCNPCLLKPDFVGKVETMKNDNEEVLRVLDVNWEGDKDSVISDRIYDEMKTVIDFNYYIVHTLKLLTACLNTVSVGERILSAFVLNGYIPESADKQLRENMPSTKEKLLNMMWKAYQSSNRTHKSVNEQRNRLRRKAFQLIPLDSLHELQRIYYDDFNLFDYRLDPPEIFYNKSVS
ncbi:hypothetical protein LOTGIDRAFT_169519 [Lottia gigantea]|uniref:Carbohydrate sulfotransferase n=1 Tax=Lottia gigantea TaxID=225164 RepID=V3ZLK2_LOTGI|nr:hypothetical protein LOTGIDRAFT_169519 [Lottia gigantea]ESO83295.1 hypothetical protein LOTGIDRAFT_169519 [Lottia gigantea]